MSPTYWRSDTTFTPEQQALVDEKTLREAEALAAQGEGTVNQNVQEIRERRQAYHDARPDKPPEVPVRVEVKDVFVSKEKLVQEVAELKPRMRAYYHWAVQEDQQYPDDPALAELLYHTWAAEMDAGIAAYPEGGRVLEVPTLHMGHHSITFPYYSTELTSSSSCTTSEGSAGGGNVYCRRGPNNVIFYGEGSDYDVEYDMTQGWTSTDWQDAGGAARYNHFWDSQHGGSDHWKDYDATLQPTYDEKCWDERHHIRIWGSETGDVHSGTPGFWNEYSFGQAHYEDYKSWTSPCHHDVISQNMGRDKVNLSFHDSSGNPLWFVGSMWDWNVSSTGTDWNGDVRIIELIA